MELNKLVEAKREHFHLSSKIELLDAFNRGPRFGQLWINGDAIELTREDYNDIVSVLRAKFARKAEELEQEIIKEVQKFN